LDQSLIEALDSKIRDALASHGVNGSARASNDTAWVELAAQIQTPDGPVSFGKGVKYSELERLGPAGLSWSFAGQAIYAFGQAPWLRSA
jgi:hypothetical protein